MCLAPSKLNDGLTVACRKCWQCLEHKVDNWVGRCIAESKVSHESAFITLTYGRDENGNSGHERSALLTYSDVQKYMMRMRKAGVEVRYFAVGELGGLNGRALWHILAFFKSPLPEGFWDYGRNAWHRAKREQPVFVPLLWGVEQYNQPLWPHGFSHWTRIAEGTAKGSIRYACKYIHKDVNDDEAQSKLAMSKTPPLGAEYFEMLAQKYVDEGISPRDGFYTFPKEAKRKDGKPLRFQLSGKSADLFRQAFIDRWYSTYTYDFPHSEYIQEYEDRMCRENASADIWELEKRVRPERRWPFMPPIGYSDKEIIWSPNGPMIITPDGPMWYGRNARGANQWSLDVPVSVWMPTEGPVTRAARMRVRMNEGAKRRRVYRGPVLTQSEWVAELSRIVDWSALTSGTGRWKRAKIQPSTGRKLWLKFLMR